MDDRCGQILEKTVGILKTTRSRHYRSNMDCSVVLRAPLNHMMLVRIIKIDIDKDFFSCSDWMQVLDGTWGKLDLTGRKCGEREPRTSYASSGRDITVKFHSDRSNNDDGFKLLFNSFHMEPCTESEFKCDNGRCISDSLKCSYRDHCGDASNICFDETTWIVIGCIALVIIIIIILIVVYYMKQKKRSRVPQYAAPQNIPLQNQPYGQPAQLGYPSPQGYPPQPAPGTGYYPQPAPGTGYPPQPAPGTGYYPQPAPDTGYPPQPAPGTGYPPQSAPDTGYPSQSAPATGYPPQSAPDTGYPPQSKPGTGYPPQPASGT
ncbi:neuropilin and tolloid-like protein 1 [Gigantopelta aegis]|uniref:neuropilin and tolloid-like protein 1 n=1 Tax=Gigantopelta aegis TaxID=1735272 RepID=UPI001B887D2E|nr:neuropilin and tolloid-like protein 1 [Gigantopelta aegis]